MDDTKIQNKYALEQAIFKGDNYRITVLSERLIRLEYSTTGEFSDNLTIRVKNRKFSVPTFKIEQDEKYIIITTNYFMLQYLKNKPFQGPKLAPDSNLKVTLLNTDKVWYFNAPEVRNFKGGTSSLDDYNGKVSLEKGLYSTDGFVSIDDSKTLEILDDGSLADPNPNKCDIYLFMYKRDFGLCLKDYFTLTGYPDLIPRYALGIWWNKERIYNFEDTKELVRTFNKYEIPLSVLLLSEFWHIKDSSNYNLYKTGFSFNKELFADPAEFVKYMHDRGVNIGLNIDPTEGIRKEEDRYQNFIQELNMGEGITVPFNVMDKNFMKVYTKHLIEPMITLGIDVFWIDYKSDLKYLSGIDYYYNLAGDTYQEYRPLVMSRSPLVAPHNVGVLYSGNTLVSWNTLKYLPFYNTVSANMGVSWWSHDIGGFKGGVEDSELYIRYIELATFSPIFRLASERGVYYKREPWAWDIKTFTIAREYCWLRQRLIPYLYTCARSYSKYGIPIIQPLYYSYPEIYDEPTYKNEYFLGSEIFVAPITKPKDATMNRSIERLYLPKGTWYDFKSGKKFIGDTRYVAFYKEDEYPVFAKEGAIIPLANLGENINDTNPPKSMEINIFPGKSNVFKLYEDDGKTKLYKDGYYIITAIDYNYLENNYTLIIHPIEGKTEIIPAKRDYKIRFRNTRQPDSTTIYVNGGVVDKYEAYVDDNDYVIDIKNVDTTKQLTINCKGTDIEINAVRIINEDINSIISDLSITTKLKETIASIFFNEELDIKKKRIEIKKINGLDKRFERMFIKLLEYIAEI